MNVHWYRRITRNRATNPLKSFLIFRTRRIAVRKFKRLKVCELYDFFILIIYSTVSLPVKTRGKPNGILIKNTFPLKKGTETARCKRYRRGLSLNKTFILLDAAMADGFGNRLRRKEVNADG